ncbi:hypothetical protein [Paenibacillus senegalensis]|uniref:hypothetical protein n=1 Tax=Paenibacillus senegalensis TaxID=1465766 RepID=UPI000289FB57|nr:hypothetical protein [Paenibacillus senegalensis]
MDRTDIYLGILESTAKMQQNISIILEAKAAETEKSRVWLAHHVHPGYFEHDHESQVKLSLEIHEQLVELINGLTKMEWGLGRNLKILLNQDQQESTGGLAGFFDTGGVG